MHLCIKIVLWTWLNYQFDVLIIDSLFVTGLCWCYFNFNLLSLVGVVKVVGSSMVSQDNLCTTRFPVLLQIGYVLHVRAYSFTFTQAHYLQSLMPYRSFIFTTHDFSKNHKHNT